MCLRTQESIIEIHPRNVSGSPGEHLTIPDLVSTNNVILHLIDLPLFQAAPQQTQPLVDMQKSTGIAGSFLQRETSA